MERRVLASLAGIGAAIILGGVAFAAASGSTAEPPPGPPPGPGPGGPPGLMLPGLLPPHALLGRLADQLGLSPEQRQTVKGFFDQARPGLEQLHKQMRANTELLMKTAPDDPAYQTVVATVSQSAADLAAQFVLQASQLRSQVHGALTQEQRNKLVLLESDLQAHLGEHRPHGPPPPGSAPRPQ